MLAVSRLVSHLGLNARVFSLFFLDLAMMTSGLGRLTNALLVFTMRANVGLSP
jgi:hypothetical protein